MTEAGGEPSGGAVMINVLIHVVGGLAAILMVGLVVGGVLLGFTER